MPRFLVKPRTPGAQPAAERMVESVVSGKEKSGARVVKRPRSPSGTHVVQLSDTDARNLATSRPDLIVEEDHPLQLFRMPGLPPMLPDVARDVWNIKVEDTEGKPVPECTVFATAPTHGFRGDTGPDGKLKLKVDHASVMSLIISPRQGYWSRVMPPPDIGQTEIRAVLTPLDAAAASSWVHRLVGLDPAHATASGRDVTIAVVDSGVSAVPGIELAGGFNTLDNANPDEWNMDEKGHGTHCAGVIGARQSPEHAFRGVAPEAKIYSVKVFPGGFVSDLIEAIDWCREKRIDLVNLSLGGPAWSEALAAAIEEATNAGVTLIAATGNDGTGVAFPASHPDVLAVSAIGREGSFPADSAHLLKVGFARDWYGGLFAANFNNYGPEVKVCAPGVAIPSTVPTGYAAWDGTSMACPLITGMLALALELYPAIRSGTRAQSETLRWLMQSSAVDTGMPPVIQGAGLPTLPRMIATASYWGLSA